MKFTRCLLALAATTVSAQLSTFDAGNGISYAVSVPDATAKSGSGDYFFQLSGPSSYQWIALGVGDTMPGSSIFVMYADGSGNVTVSPRLGVGFVEPEHNPQAKLTLLEGTGIANGTMTANVKCSDCSTWQGGHSIDFTSTSQSFIHAMRTGAPLDTTDVNAELVQHQNNGIPFQFDLVQATGGSTTANPFMQSPTSGGGGGVSGGSGGESGSSGSSEDSDSGDSLLKAHGIIMGLTVAVLLPLGALIVRLFSVPWWLHGGIQIVFVALLTAGFGTGYVEAGKLGIRYTGEGKTHTIFGTVLFAFFWLQPFLGTVHHISCIKAGKRTVFSHVHIWFGRIILILAMVNGGLGLQLSDNSTGGEIAYGVICGIVGVAYIAGATFGELRRNKTVGSQQTQKAEG